MPAVTRTKKKTMSLGIKKKNVLESVLRKKPSKGKNKVKNGANIPADKKKTNKNILDATRKKDANAKKTSSKTPVDTKHQFDECRRFFENFTRDTFMGEKSVGLTDDNPGTVVFCDQTDSSPIVVLPISTMQRLMANDELHYNNSGHEMKMTDTYGEIRNFPKMIKAFASRLVEGAEMMLDAGWDEIPLFKHRVERPGLRNQ
jgi:hypothetical protein